MNLRMFLARSPELSDAALIERFASHWSESRLSKGAVLTRQEESDADEFILLDGCMASTIGDADGKEVCVGLYLGPCVVTPNIARTRDGVSLVSTTAITDALLVRINTDQLTALMISSEPVRNWANGVLRHALSEKADREWCLAALGGADRLTWFRQRFQGYEDIFTHAQIASFLGITPVTMSRLRASVRPE